MAIELLQVAADDDGPRVASLLAPHAWEDTSNARDPFDVVADLDGDARQGGDVLEILEAIAPALPDARKEFWAAES